MSAQYQENGATSHSRQHAPVHPHSKTKKDVFADVRVVADATARAGESNVDEIWVAIVRTHTHHAQRTLHRGVECALVQR